ncbi:MAG: ATP-binding cassette domain-containing protein [Peptoniphilaceae bacterium]
MINIKIGQLLKKYPFVEMFFSENRLDVSEYKDLSFSQYLETFSQEEKEELAIDDNLLIEGLETYIEQMKSFLGVDDDELKSISVVAGKDKFGNKENYNVLQINKSEIVSIVGPTGSGKSRLLADIEWVADRDTQTNRKILINGKDADKKWRFSTNNKLVSQLSQNMNFVMDLSAYEFIKLHARSRMVESEEEIINKIIIEANKLAGEKFDLNTPITSLSGGQSRALMIADTAILSSSPIVLIDEIENAGIDRKKALDLLINENKIVLMATHDPILALIADKRIVINNGGIVAIYETTDKEKELLVKLEEIDNVIQDLRKELRYGKSLDDFEINI